MEKKSHKSRVDNGVTARPSEPAGEGRCWFISSGGRWYSVPERKECGQCGVEKEAIDFGYSGNAPDKLQAWCKKCQSEVGGAMARMSEEDRKWKMYMEQLYQDSIKPGAPAATRDLYATLMGKKIEKREVTLGVSGDEIARRNLEAQRLLSLELEKEVSNED